MPLPAAVERTVTAYLADADRFLPGWVRGSYVVGSTALGAWRESRSDVDFVAVVDGALDGSRRRRLRAVHARSGARTAAAAVRKGHSPLAGPCNGYFVRERDLTRPVTAIAPVAGHIGNRLVVGGSGGSDVSPAAWKVLTERGIAVRGPTPAALGLDPEPARLAEWNRRRPGLVAWPPAARPPVRGAAPARDTAAFVLEVVAASA